MKRDQYGIIGQTDKDNPDYFNGWRDRAEIGQGLKMRIGQEIFGHE